MSIDTFDDFETEEACIAINRFSKGGHPVATPENLKFFLPAFIKEMVEKTRATNTDPDLAEVYDDMIAQLS